MKRKGLLALGAFLITTSLTFGSASAATTYVVKKGDTLYSISTKYHVTVDELKKSNKLNSNLIKIGQKLSIPTKSTPAPSNPKPGTPKPGTSSPTTTTAPQKVDKVIATGKNYLGKPYKAGGVGPNGFDCSGFTQTAFKGAGINLPRVTRDQAKVGTSTGNKVANLRKGDLVVFKEGGTVFHVGISLGGTQFIHSQSGKGVSISDLNNVYWKPRFAEGRRIIK